jgi:hypothetical protein
MHVIRHDGSTWIEDAIARVVYNPCESIVTPGHSKRKVDKGKINMQRRLKNPCVLRTRAHVSDSKISVLVSGQRQEFIGKIIVVEQEEGPVRIDVRI